MEYFNLDNGGVTFKIVIDGNIITIYKVSFDEDSNIIEEKEVLKFICKKVFLGESITNDMTRFSGGYNISETSFLFQIDDDNTYIYVGSEVYSFKAKNEIVKFISAVGNSAVVYSWAVDSEDNYYLMEYGKVIMIKYTITDENNIDPYDKYYKDDDGITLPTVLLVPRR